MSKFEFVDPIVGPRGQKQNSVRIKKTKENTVLPVYTKTPHFFALWVELFSVE